MKMILTLLLLCSPAAAQSFYPNLAGQRYCQLRGYGVGHDDAFRIAITENYAPDRPKVPVTAHGVSTYTDVLDFYGWLQRCG